MSAQANYAIRNPDIADGAAIWQLVRDCPPLDVNSAYFYLILCQHFKDTCLVAEDAGQIIGFVSAYIPPGSSDVLFVWQIAVHASARGRGLARGMLMTLLQQPPCKRAAFLETTISPSNAASRKLFTSLAADLHVSCQESVYFQESHFPPAERHESEVLYRIGPLDESLPKE